MQDFDKLPDNAKLVVRHDAVIVNGAYAALHAKTGLFHRVRVEHQVGEDYLVNFVDYGDKALVPLTSLRPLSREFLKLPAQALPAKLAGVAPAKHGDWGADEVLAFQQLVDHKEFYSYVVRVGADRVLQLHLVDNSGDRDVIISKFLVDNNLAVLSQSPV